MKMLSTEQRNFKQVLFAPSHGPHVVCAMSAVHPQGGGVKRRRRGSESQVFNCFRELI